MDGSVYDPGMPTVPLRRPGRRHFVVCGDDALTYRLVEELTGRHGEDVTVILPSRKRNYGPQLSRLANVRFVEAQELAEEAFHAARLTAARAVALVRQDDVGNIHAALRAQEVHPDVRLVVRMFNVRLGNRIQELFADCVVLSDASIAAPAFVAAALGEVDGNHVRHHGRTLYVASRETVPPGDVVCGLADTSGQRPVLLPTDGGSATIVLAMGTGPPPRPARRPAIAATLWRGVRPVVVGPLWLASLVLLAMIIGGTTAWAHLQRLSWPRAAYVMLLTAVGGGANPDPYGRLGEQITQVVVTLAGVALIPVATAAIVQVAVNARLASALNTPEPPPGDHVIVVGLGNLGSRIVRQLHDRGVPVVAIDTNEQAPGVATARARGITVYAGDATRPQTLRTAGVDTCRALIAAAHDDITNLEVAMEARDLRGDLRVVLRLFDGELAARVERHFGIPISRSVSFLAAPAFAAAMVQREVIRTIPVGRRVLLLAELPVAAGSRFAGQPVRLAEDGGSARVIAVRAGTDTAWQPAADMPVPAGARLLIVATRTGLGRVLAGTVPPETGLEAVGVS